MVNGITDYAISVLDTTGHVVAWNKGAQRIKGYRPEEILGHHMSEFYPPEEVAARKPDRELEIAARIGQLGGYVAAVNFVSPLKILGLDDAGWERLKWPTQWDQLNVSEARALRLLNFIAFDFSDPAKAALESLAEDRRLAAYVDEYKSIVATNGGHIIVKCAFQMISKSQKVAKKLDEIAFQLSGKMRDFLEEMAAEMRRS